MDSYTVVPRRLEQTLAKHSATTLLTVHEPVKVGGMAKNDSKTNTRIDNEINELRDLVENHTDAIDQTLDATSQIARSLEKLVNRHESRNRFQQLNSFVAYCLFTILLGGGFALLYRSRATELVAARDLAVESAQAAQARARELQDAKTDRQKAALAAADFYRLIHDGRHAEVIEGFEKLSSLDLSEAERAMFEDGVGRARTGLVNAGYAAGVAAFRRGDYEGATAELRRGLLYAEDGERAAQMRYYLGIALSRQGAYDEGIKELRLALASDIEGAGIEDARFHLGNTLVQNDKVDEARQMFIAFYNAHPNHRFAQMARRKAAQILRAERERERMAQEAPKPLAPAPVDLEDQNAPEEIEPPKTEVL